MQEVEKSRFLHAELEDSGSHQRTEKYFPQATSGSLKGRSFERAIIHSAAVVNYRTIIVVK